MTQDLSITALILHASLVVQLVMAGLLLTSLTSWTVIFGKLFGLRRVRGRNDDFEREFWSGRSLTELNTAVGQKADTAPMERIFASGMREFLKLREKRLDAGAQLDGARRAMRASFQRELDVVESNLSFLASVGSVSPYVGLFGTVWGIMHAFVGLSNMQQVTLATVAPGIAEALVATAIGLFAAIPRWWPTTVLRATSTASPSSWKPSSRSSATSCSATPARPAPSQTGSGPR
jgi:biopolymer transport protein TolQ